MVSSIAAGAAPWATVLAGGESERMQPLIRSWLGYDRPKPYCAFLGDHSMLRHTLDRVRDVVPPDRTMTVINGKHRGFLDQALSGQTPGRLFEQPVDRGTAPGVFLPVTQIMEEDPEGTVLILPSDHFVFPRERFVDHIRFASLLLDQFRDHVVLLGAAPDGPENDQGWIVPGQRKQAWASHPFVPAPFEVASFQETAPRNGTRALDHRGCLWNTMITVARVSTLWRLGWEHLPEMMRRFESLRQVVRAVREGRVTRTHQESALDHVYTHLEAADFSRHLLERSASSVLALPMDGVHWSDWGMPERVTSTLARIGRRPAFTASIAAGETCMCPLCRTRPGAPSPHHEQ